MFYSIYRSDYISLMYTTTILRCNRFYTMKNTRRDVDNWIESDKSSPFILYNHIHKECCSDGKVQAIGQC